MKFFIKHLSNNVKVEKDIMSLNNDSEMKRHVDHTNFWGSGWKISDYLSKKIFLFKKGVAKSFVFFAKTKFLQKKSWGKLCYTEQILLFTSHPPNGNQNRVCNLIFSLKSKLLELIFFGINLDDFENLEELKNLTEIVFVLSGDEILT